MKRVNAAILTFLLTAGFLGSGEVQATARSGPQPHSAATKAFPTRGNSAAILQRLNRTGLSWRKLNANRVFPYGVPAGVVAAYGATGMNCLVLTFNSRQAAYVQGQSLSSMGNPYLGKLVGWAVVIVDGTSRNACISKVNDVLD